MIIYSIIICELVSLPDRFMFSFYFNGASCTLVDLPWRKHLLNSNHVPWWDTDSEHNSLYITRNKEIFRTQPVEV